MRGLGRWRAPLRAERIRETPSLCCVCFITSLMGWKLLYVLRKARDGENNCVPLCFAHAVSVPTQPRWCHNEDLMGHRLGIVFSPICCFLVCSHIKLQDEIKNTIFGFADDSNFWSFWQKSYDGRKGRLNPLSFIPIQWQKREYSLIFPRVISLNRAQLSAAEHPRSQAMARDA